jgi:hypothetical protein
MSLGTSLEAYELHRVLHRAEDDGPRNKHEPRKAHEYGTIHVADG